jgi:hypothetical protein
MSIVGLVKTYMASVMVENSGISIFHKVLKQYNAVQLNSIDEVL